MRAYTWILLMTLACTTSESRPQLRTLPSVQPNVGLLMLSTRDQIPKHDLEITLANGDLGENSTTYIWAGSPIGIGQNGLNEVVRRLKTLEPGTGVVFFPEYQHLSAPTNLVYIRMEAALVQIARESRLLIVLSPRAPGVAPFGRSSSTSTSFWDDMELPVQKPSCTKTRPWQDGDTTSGRTGPSE